MRLLSARRRVGSMIKLGMWAVCLGAVSTVKLRAESPSLSDSKGGRAVLSGEVRSEKGFPIRGVTVVIHEAKPRSPRNGLSPQCYPDCLRTAVTDESGRFSIPNVDGSLLYRLLVAKESFESKYLTDVDCQVPNLQVSLARSQFEGAADVRGRVVDARGEPVAGAEIIPRGYMKGNEGMTGPMEKYASVVASDNDGYFWIYTFRPVDSLELEIRARGCVTTKFNSVQAGFRNLQVLRLDPGATIRGRLLKDKQAVTGAIMGTVFTKRQENDFSGPWETVTDSTGHFQLTNITAGQEIYVYGKMSSFQGVGIVEPIKLTTGVTGAFHELGDVPISPGHKLTGRVVFGDGKKPPAGLKLRLARSVILDVQTLDADNDGRFEFSDVPTGLYTLTALSKNNIWPPPFHLSPKNRSLDPFYLSSLEGIIDNDSSITVGLDQGISSERRAPFREEDIRLKQALRHNPIEGLPDKRPEHASDR